VSKDKKEADPDRWLWWVFVAPCVAVGYVVGARTGGEIGAVVGVVLLFAYATHQWLRDRRRKRKAEAEAIAEAVEDTEAGENDRGAIHA